VAAVCYIVGAFNTVCPAGTEIDPAPNGNTASSGDCYDYFASVGNAGSVSVSNLATNYPKGCWTSGSNHYFNTGAGGPHPSLQPICYCQPPAGVLVGGMRWYKSAGGSAPSCNSICTGAVKTCNAASIRSATLESSCATQNAVLTGYGLSGSGCTLCGPSDSTNNYCFPGRAGHGPMYYHTSFAAGGFNCATVPSSSTNPSICPCT